MTAYHRGEHFSGRGHITLVFPFNSHRASLVAVLPLGIFSLGHINFSAV
jgi:hypothetical protein